MIALRKNTIQELEKIPEEKYNNSKFNKSFIPTSSEQSSHACMDI